MAFQKRLRYTPKTGAYTISVIDDTIDCNGTFTVTLPPASKVNGKPFNIKNSGIGIITLDGDGSETIGGSTTAQIFASQNLNVQSTGSNWIII